MSVELSLVLPFYNEEVNVEWVLEEMIQALDEKKIVYELILVNNGSWDKTLSLLDHFAKKYPDKLHIVTVEKNEGYGWGILQGLKVAKGLYVGYTPGDGQVPASDIAQVYLKAKELNLDFVQGQRIRKDTFLRRFNTLIYNFTFHLFFRADVYDIGSNPKIIKKDWYERIELTSKDWFIDSEIVSKTALFKGKMKEFPVTFRKREKGSSHINIFSVFEMIINLIRWKLKTIHF